jgi:non-specific serine/threonine protein kinase
MELAELTSFVGRVWEIEELRTLMSTSRLVTLTGAGGCGKSRLAYRVARSLSVPNPTIIELASVTEPTLLPSVVARALGSPDSGGSNPTQWLMDYLGREPALMVWDNCEHLVDACATLAATLLKSSDTVRLLCTSRQPLSLPGEKPWLVPSLSYPTGDYEGNAIDQHESVRLFVDRATAASHGFTQTPASEPAIAAICRRLEGIPLAIELAAARTNVLAPAQILAMLDDALSLLQSNERFVERQRTLESTIDWSYGLLSEADRFIFMRAGVFAGSFDIDAAVDVCCDAQIPPDRLVNGLSSLIDRSLVAANTSNTIAQYHMLEPVRQYALRLLKNSGEESMIRRAHLRHYLEVGERAEPHLFGDREQPDWLARVDQQLPEIRSALAWAFSEEPQQGARLTILLGWFWWLRAYFVEGDTWIRRAIEATANQPSLRAAALRFDGHLALRAGDNRRGMSRALEAIPIYRHLKDEEGLAMSLFMLGCAARSLGHLSRAHVLLEASLSIRDRPGSPAAGIVLGELGVLAMLAQDWQVAEARFRDAIAHQRTTGDHWGLGLTLANLAELYVRRSDWRSAAPLIAESIEIMRPMGDPFTVAQLLDYAGMVAIAAGDGGIGLRFMGAADFQRQRLQLRSTPVSRDLVESWMDRAQGILGQHAARRALEAGRETTVSESLALAEAAMTAAPGPSGGLTRREREVAQLIGDGLTDREIAGRLFISRRTAEGHVVQILNKLGFRRRSQIAGWLSREGVSAAVASKDT